jgi:hypothetical protein
MDDHTPGSSGPSEPSPERPAAESAEPALAPRGRAARLQAEDAADAAARTQRWRGFGERSGAEAGETIESPPAAAEEPITPETPPPRQRSGALVAAVIVVGLIATGFYAVPRMAGRLHPSTATLQVESTAPPAPPAAAPAAPTPSPPAQNAQPAPNLDAVRKEIDARIAAANAQSAAPAAPVAPGDLGAAVGTQAQQMAALSARVATLEAALGNSAKLDDLAKRIAALESKSADAASVLALSERVRNIETSARTAVAEQTARVGLLLAIAQWRDAVNAGRPYQLELDSLKVLSTRASVPLGLDDPAIAAHARSGIATLDALRSRFDDNAGRVLRATAIPNGVRDWIARAFDRVFAIVTIRRVDGLVEGNTPSAILARAGAYLRDGNLGAAVTEMESLSGPPADAAKPWLDEARARVATESAATDATSKVIAMLGATSAQGSAEKPAEKTDP